MQKNLIIIVGPTAVGKTSIAIQLAEALGTEIISADSRQCYRELNIGVARPTPEELARVPHHFIASHSIHDKVTAATFEAYALEKLQEIFNAHDHAVMVGGTGLYIKAFCEGLDEIPEVPEAIHRSVIESYQQHGLPWLQEQLRNADPDFYQRGEIQNPQRMMRALEVFKATGRPITAFRKQKKLQRPFGIMKFGLELPRAELRQRIDQRVDKMVEQGLVDEVRGLIPYQQLNALQTVGYKELFDHFNGELSIQDAIAAIKTNTRRYAKRQMTWFRKDAEIRWSRLEELNIELMNPPSLRFGGQSETL